MAFIDQQKRRDIDHEPGEEVIALAKLIAKSIYIERKSRHYVWMVMALYTKRWLIGDVPSLMEPS